MDIRVVLFALGGLEGKMVAMKSSLFSSHSEKGQSAAVFAVVVTALVIFVLGVMDYMVTTARAMEAVAIADLSAHAGTARNSCSPQRRHRDFAKWAKCRGQVLFYASKVIYAVRQYSCGRIHGKASL